MTNKLPLPFTPIPQYQVTQINIREYVYVVLKRKRMILYILLLVVALVLIYTFLQTPTYRSIAKLNVDPSGYNVFPEVTQRLATDMFLETQTELLMSRTLASRVQKKLNLAPQDLVPAGEREETAKEWSTRAPEQRTEWVTNQLLASVTVEPVPKTTLFGITFLSPDPELSKKLADTWSSEYVEYSLASQYEYTRKAEELLAKQIAGLQKEIEEGQKVLQDYSTREQVILLENARSINTSKLDSINQSLSAATSQRITAEVAYRDLQKHGIDAVPEIRINGVIQRLKQEYALLEAEYSQKEGLYSPDFPTMQNLKRKMDQLQASMDAEASDIFAKVIASAKAQYLDALKREAALQSELDYVKGLTIQGRKEEIDYDRLKSEVEEKQRRLETLLQKQSEASIASQAKEMKATTIRIVDEGLITWRPYKPNIFYNIGFSILAGLLLGVGFAFLLDYLDRSFKDAQDIERYTELPFLGIIPKYQSETNNNGKPTTLVKRENTGGIPSESIDLLTIYNPDSPESEAFRTVRASLLVSFPEAAPRIILVTSSQIGEGKTFVACNLAISLAQMQKKVVIVDADMRNPRVHRIWKISNQSGLSTFLTSDVKASAIICPSRFDGISLIPSGAKTPRPSELLSSKRFDELLQQLQTEFDHVIVDSPPIIPVSDPLILASKCNCVVMIIRAGETPREAVQLAKQKLLHFEANIAGVILNDVDLTDPFYHYNYYALSGKYHEERS